MDDPLSLNTLHQVFDLVHIQLDMRIHLQILVVSRMNLSLDILLEVGHLGNS